MNIYKKFRLIQKKHNAIYKFRACLKFILWKLDNSKDTKLLERLYKEQQILKRAVKRLKNLK